MILLIFILAIIGATAFVGGKEDKSTTTSIIGVGMMTLAVILLIIEVINVNHL